MKTKYALWILSAAFLFFVAAAVWGNPTLVSIATALFCCSIGLCVGQLLKKKEIDITKKTKLKMLGFGIVILMADILIVLLFQKHTTAIITVVALTLICSAIMYAVAIQHRKTE